MLHLGENTARWSNLIGELVREYSMYYPAWHKIEEEKRVHIMGWLMVNLGEMLLDALLDVRPTLHILDVRANLKRKWGIKVKVMESSMTYEYPSHISTFFDNHTYDGVFAQDEARVKYVRGASSGGTFPGLVGFSPERAKPPSLSMSLEVRTPMPRLMRLKKRSSEQGGRDYTQLIQRERSAEGNKRCGSGGGRDDEPSRDEDTSGDEDVSGDDDI
ncbi:hypothetical protein Tco_0635571 [Tanacetum coccineum]